jgi:quercetin dioxygenase-like cupin family protein
MILRLYTADDGQSHLTELQPPMAPSAEALQAATGIVFRRSEPGHFVDWHNASRRQYIITLSGHVEIGLGDGTVRRLGPGDVMLAEDLTGKGHTTRTVGNEPRVSVAIPLA